MTVTLLRKRMIMQFVDLSGQSDGSYTNSNIKDTAGDFEINLTARAMNRLQRRNLDKLFVDVETVLAD